MLEREVKLAVTPGFRLPDLDDVAAAVETTPVDEHRLETVYYDTPDLRLARWGCNFRLRQGEGWTLKLPTTSEGPTLTRRELEFPGSGGRPPEAAVALVIAYVRRSTLVPVASLSTLRRRGAGPSDPRRLGRQPAAPRPRRAPRRRPGGCPSRPGRDPTVALATAHLPQPARSGMGECAARRPALAGRRAGQRTRPAGDVPAAARPDHSTDRG